MSRDLDASWTIGDQIKKSASRLDAIEAEATAVAGESGDPEPQWAATLAVATQAAWSAAAIAEAGRERNTGDALDLVPSASAMLTAGLARFELLAGPNWKLAPWPKTWGIKFGKLATDSALEAAVRFAHQVRCVCWVEAQRHGGYEDATFRRLPILYDPFVESAESTRPAEAWALAVLSRVNYVIPAEWQSWKIRTETNALVSLMRGEYVRLQENFARQKEIRQLGAQTHALLAAAVDEVRARAATALAQESGQLAEVDVARVAADIGTVPDAFKRPAFFARFRINSDMLRQLVRREGVRKQADPQRSGYNLYRVGDVIRARPHLFPVPPAQPDDIALQA